MSDSFSDSGTAVQNEVMPGAQAAPQQKKGPSGCMIAGIGCGAITLILVAAGAYGVWWLKGNIRQVGTDFAVTAMKDSLKELEIPDEQRDRIDARIDEVGQLFKDEQLTMEQVGGIFAKLSESPLMSAGIALYFQRAYVRDSGLSEEEKTAAELAARRFIRGSIDEEISEATRESVLDEISEKDEEGARQFPESLADEQLRGFVASMKKAADDAGVAEDIPEINLADEFDVIIDQALAEAGVGAGAETPQDDGPTQE